MPAVRPPELARTSVTAAAVIASIAVLGLGPAPGAARAASAPALIPRPAALHLEHGRPFRLTPRTRIAVGAEGRPAAARVAAGLAALLRRSTGFALPLVPAGPDAGDGVVSLALADVGLGAEGYRLRVTGRAVRLRAATAAGLVHGVQTLRQLLPARVERRTRQAGPWPIPRLRVADRPRFAYRGAMIDVARHFFGVRDVERYLDVLALYKLNTLHLHLSDDQGWRIAIGRWPRLARHGGRTEVGGTPGGAYSAADLRRIVRYARERAITVVPEVDGPGHVTAALASYPELACDGRPRPLYTGVAVGFSSLCATKAVTYRFLDDVVAELTRLVPGAIFHLGGDEAHSTAAGDYARYVGRAAGIVRRHGRQVMGWQEIATAAVPRGSVVEYWSPASGSAPGTELARTAVRRGLRLVMAPASRAYLDQQYAPGDRLGLSWAGHVEAREAYSWDPASFVDGVRERDVLGVEAPLWTETLPDRRSLELMALPRLPGIAELGWSARRGRSWARYRPRLAGQSPRWRALRLAFHRSPGVPWR